MFEDIMFELNVFRLERLVERAFDLMSKRKSKGAMMRHYRLLRALERINGVN